LRGALTARLYVVSVKRVVNVETWKIILGVSYTSVMFKSHILSSRSDKPGVWT